MNYCSIEDAWGRQNHASDQINNYMIDKGYKSEPVQSCNKSQQNNVKPNKLIQYENFESVEPLTSTIQNVVHQSHDELYDCNSFFNHIKNCRKCYSRMKNRFRPKLIENFSDIVDDNRDVIVMILIGISIILFFNLINNVTKNK